MLIPLLIIYIFNSIQCRILNQIIMLGAWGAPVELLRIFLLSSADFVQELRKSEWGQKNTSDKGCCSVDAYISESFTILFLSSV